MFCPYIRKTHTVLTLYGYDENNIDRGSLVQEYFTNEKCRKKKCGAYYRGKCRYKGNAHIEKNDFNSY